MTVAVAAGTVAEALTAATDAFAAAGVESPRLDAELLLAAASGSGRAGLAARPEAAVDAEAGRRFGAMVRRRVRREPLAYILGRRGFRRIDLEVDPRVLIPRPETELLVELALELQPRRVLDVGTGSGAIALAIADELPGCVVTATDTSPHALERAAANARRLGLDERVEFVSGTLPAGEDHDLVVANLPYVASAEWERLAPEIRDFEPPEALLAGADGLDAIRGLCDALAPAVEAGRVGAVGLEHGSGQAEEVTELLAAAGLDNLERRRDLAGFDRVVVGHAPADGPGATKRGQVGR